MEKWSWERLARDEVKVFNRRTRGNVTIELRENKNIEVVLKVTPTAAVIYDLDNWHDAYITLSAMSEAYLLGFKGGL